MAAPNLINTSSIYGKTTAANLGTSNVSYVTCPANKVLKINTIIVTNVDGTNAADVIVYYYDAGQATYFRIASTISVPADSTLVVLSKDTSIY